MTWLEQSVKLYTEGMFKMVELFPVPCPFCTGIANLHPEKRTLTFRKQQFEILFFYYKCPVCLNDFTTTESDEVAMLFLKVAWIVRNEHIL